jgi:hypothetical protein
MDPLGYEGVESQAKAKVTRIFGPRSADRRHTESQTIQIAAE